MTTYPRGSVPLGACFCAIAEQTAGPSECASGLVKCRIGNVEALDNRRLQQIRALHFQPPKIESFPATSDAHGENSMNDHRSQTLEELAKFYGWDDELIRLLGILPRAVADQYIEQAWSYDKDGWRHLLPPLPASASVLCLDTRFGNTAAAFAETGLSVTVIHPCPVTVRIIRHRLASINLSNVEVIH